MSWKVSELQVYRIYIFTLLITIFSFLPATNHIHPSPHVFIFTIQLYLSVRYACLRLIPQFGQQLCLIFSLITFFSHQLPTPTWLRHIEKVHMNLLPAEIPLPLLLFFLLLSQHYPSATRWTSIND